MFHEVDGSSLQLHVLVASFCIIILNLSHLHSQVSIQLSISRITEIEKLIIILIIQRYIYNVGKNIKLVTNFNTKQDTLLMT